MSEGIKDPLGNIRPIRRVELDLEDETEDKCREIAFEIVLKWDVWLRQEGHIKGVLGLSGELVQLITQELRKHDITMNNGN